MPLWFMSAFGGLWGYVAIGVVALGLGTYGGAQVTAWKKDATISSIQKADALALANAEKAARKDQADRDKITHDADVKAATRDQKTNTVYVTLTKEVPVHVHEKALPCIPLGFVRVLDAAVLQTNPDTLSLPAGDSDDTCAAVEARSLANSIIANYQAGQTNGDHLQDFQDWARKEEALNPAPPN